MNIVVLDYSDGYVYHYKISQEQHGVDFDVQAFLEKKSHKINDIHYMCTSATEYNVYCTSKNREFHEQ